MENKETDSPREGNRFGFTAHPHPDATGNPYTLGDDYEAKEDGVYAVIKPDSSDLSCPFCKESDFDLVGLKIHLERGYCEPFNNTITA